MNMHRALKVAQEELTLPCNLTRKFFNTLDVTGVHSNTVVTNTTIDKRELQEYLVSYVSVGFEHNLFGKSLDVAEEYNEANKDIPNAVGVNFELDQCPTRSNLVVAAELLKNKSNVYNVLVDADAYKFYKKSNMPLKDGVYMGDYIIGKFTFHFYTDAFLPERLQFIRGVVVGTDEPWGFIINHPNVELSESGEDKIDVKTESLFAISITTPLVIFNF